MSRATTIQAMRDGEDRTLEEVGQQFNVTRERLRQIAAKALSKLKRHSRKLDPGR